MKDLLTRTGCRARVCMEICRQAALADAEESLTIARHYGFSAFIARSLEFRGRARAGLGDLAAGIEDFREALALWGKSGVGVLRQSVV